MNEKEIGVILINFLLYYLTKSLNNKLIGHKCPPLLSVEFNGY